jgi:exodeoxyribonuclease V alpha subunit
LLNKSEIVNEHFSCFIWHKSAGYCIETRSDMSIFITPSPQSTASTALLTQLARWVTAGAVRQVDVALARLIHERCPMTAAPVLLAVALTSERNSHGHVCLDLTAAHQHPETLLLARRPEAQQCDVTAELKALFAAFTLPQWLEQLRHSVAIADQFSGAAAADTAPLVLAGTAQRPLLYLRRYWRDEQRIVSGITARLQHPLAVDEPALRQLLDRLFAAVDPTRLAWEKIACALAARSAFAIITGGPGTGKTTTVVRLLALLQGLALSAGQPLLRIRLAAPTGKAAARLNESIAGRVAELPLADLSTGAAIRAAIPTAVTTLHRLLGPRQHSRHFHHHAGQPLPVDAVVIDEASMVDVEMLARLLEALRPNARLILLGDKDQLASVEAGAVLGDLCTGAAAGHYTAATCDWLQRVTGATVPEEYRDPRGRALDQTVAMLRHSYRFDRHGGIGALAAAVNAPTAVRQQRLETVLALFVEESPPPLVDKSPPPPLFQRGEDKAPSFSKGAFEKSPQPPLLKGAFEESPQSTFSKTALSPPCEKGGAGGICQLTALHLPNPSPDTPECNALICNGYRGYLTALRDGDPGAAAPPAAIAEWALTVLHAQAQFQLLTALREGVWGVSGLNEHIIKQLHHAGLLDGAPAAPQHWFAGRPVLVTRNDPNLGLMNGDIGITLAVPLRQTEAAAAQHRVLRVAFPAGDGSGGVRWILPSRLQAVETVFAMTVHKAQGSEFDHTALILPDLPNPVLTQELLYTAITRSKQAFTLIYHAPAVLDAALQRRVARISGIAATLNTEINHDEIK